jgi:hypothetical protein
VPKESVSLVAKRAFPFGIDGRRRPGRTAVSTAVPCVLLTRKRTEVQLLPRPPHRSEQGFCRLARLLVVRFGGQGGSSVGRAHNCFTEGVFFGVEADVDTRHGGRGAYELAALIRGSLRTRGSTG